MKKRPAGRFLFYTEFAEQFVCFGDRRFIRAFERRKGAFYRFRFGERRFQQPPEVTERQKKHAPPQNGEHLFHRAYVGKGPPQKIPALSVFRRAVHGGVLHGAVNAAAQYVVGERVGFVGNFFAAEPPVSERAEFFLERNKTERGKLAREVIPVEIRLFSL